MTSSQSNVIKFEQLLEQLTQTIQRTKVQTGELAETKNEISEINRTLRGHNGDTGLVGRVERLHDKLNVLVDRQLPDMLHAVQSAVEMAGKAGTEMQQCRIHHDAELARLRSEFEQHLKQEEKEEKRFGGREWFQENASSILLSAITLVINALITAYIVSRIVP